MGGVRGDIGKEERKWPETNERMSDDKEQVQNVYREEPYAGR